MLIQLLHNLKYPAIITIKCDTTCCPTKYTNLNYMAPNEYPNIGDIIILIHTSNTLAYLGYYFYFIID